MRHPTEERLLLHHYGDVEGPERAAIDEHLRTCQACRDRLAALARTLAAVRPLPVPERPADYGSQVWARLQPKLAGQRRAKPLLWGAASAGLPWWRGGTFPLDRLAYAAGVAVLVVAAFVAGRFWPPPTPVPNAAAPGVEQAAQPAPPDRVRELILVLEVGEHLERSQVALLEVLNAPAESGPIDLSRDQERVRELVAENRLYRLTAIDAGENGMASVLDELERALIEIANSPSRLSTTEFERVRGEIDAQGLVFKVRVLGDSLRRRQTKPA
ncbi:MAG TPA: zf-HC2 domain-containing protein [Vicinamibacterales bacterium]|nr:zf-HC2 domain-containing protein [Vicinamibacterales bacterium]